MPRAKKEDPLSVINALSDGSIKKPSKSDKAELKATGEVSEAIRDLVVARDQAKEAKAKEERAVPIIKGFGIVELAKQLLKTPGKHASINLVAETGETVMYTPTDSYKKASFDTVEAREAFKKDLEGILGKGQASEFVEERTEYTVNPEALTDPEVLAAVVGVAKLAASKGFSFLRKSEVAEIKKGSLDKIASSVKTVEQAQQALAIIQPTIQLRTK